MARGLILFILIFITLACQTAAEHPRRGLKSFKIDYRYVDSPQQKKILLYYRNTNRSSVCFGPENWPQKGILLNPGNEVYLKIAEQRYYLGPENDYCPRCNQKVLPGAELQGFFDYRSFGLPSQIEGSGKKLSFSPVGFSCR